ncbi:zinc finger protein-like [Tropilaelaps mercedesae]|uniref:Zinc finger protein-like n=1 Tax=Tropilaelaps mercedesae TaxID=418985 RepID=A0A1V9Y1G8_9ACAR|nr:zinc finger protein-like [Tropilaelaps mercedesae]
MDASVQFDMRCASRQKVQSLQSVPAPLVSSQYPHTLSTEHNQLLIKQEDVILSTPEDTESSLAPFLLESMASPLALDFDSVFDASVRLSGQPLSTSPVKEDIWTHGPKQCPDPASGPVLIVRAGEPKANVCSGQLSGNTSSVAVRGTSGATVNESLQAVKNRKQYTQRAEKDRTCPICSKSFPSPSHVRTHIRKHTQEKPFVCPHCDFRSAQKGNLKGHIFARHRKLYMRP